MDILTPAAIASELLEPVGERYCVAWVGSGLSRNAAYRNWPTAVSDLCAACDVAGLANPGATPTADELMDKAEECKRANLEAYEETLAGIFGRPVGRTRQAYSWLIKAPFKAYVTTNFDSLLSEAAQVGDCTDLRYYPVLPGPDIERCTKPIFYIHGHARPDGVASGRSLVFARSEFDTAYGDAGVVREFVQYLLVNYPIVFIGCSLREPAIFQAIKRVHRMHAQMRDSRSGYRPPPRFALLPTILSDTAHTRDNDAEMAEMERFSDLDTRVLRYDPIDRGEQWEIEEVLKILCQYAPGGTQELGNEGTR